jgi:hypothetical protein
MYQINEMVNAFQSKVDKKVELYEMVCADQALFKIWIDNFLEHNPLAKQEGDATIQGLVQEIESALKQDKMTLQECSENLTENKNQRKDFEKNQKALELEIKKFNN